MVGEKIYLKRKLAGIADHLWDSLAVLTYPKITGKESESIGEGILVSGEKCVLLS